MRDDRPPTKIPSGIIPRGGLIIVLSVLLSSFISGCGREDTRRRGPRRAATTQTPATVTTTTQTVITEEPSAPNYSPFVLDVDADVPFAIISFKDVGMSLPSTDQAFVYESLAESLASELDGREIMSRVRHVPEILDPNNHVACEGEHIYVDLWKSSSSAGDRFGYSLWSGCGEDDRFAFQDERVLATVDALAQDIASSLSNAVETRCFTRLC